MQPTQRFRNVVRRLMQTYAGPAARRRLWNAEFKSGHWDFLDDSAYTDCVYGVIDTRSKRGSVLDLGCGSGSTAQFFAAQGGHTYVGVDVSDVAIAKAIQRCSGLSDRGTFSFRQGDIEVFEPGQDFDLILFRDSIYYLQPSRIVPTIRRYMSNLKDDGVMIIRIAGANERYVALVALLRSTLGPSECLDFHDPPASVLVFRPRTSGGDS